MSVSHPQTRCYFFTILISFLLCGITPSAVCQTDTFIAGSGNWSNMNNWSLGQLPQSNNDCVFLAGSVITDDAAGTCQNVTFASGDSLTIGWPCWGESDKPAAWVKCSYTPRLNPSDQSYGFSPYWIPHQERLSRRRPSELIARARGGSPCHVQRKSKPN